MRLPWKTSEMGWIRKTQSTFPASDLQGTSGKQPANPCGVTWAHAVTVLPCSFWALKEHLKGWPIFSSMEGPPHSRASQPYCHCIQVGVPAFAWTFPISLSSYTWVTIILIIDNFCKSDEFETKANLVRFQGIRQGSSLSDEQSICGSGCTPREDRKNLGPHAVCHQPAIWPRAVHIGTVRLSLHMCQRKWPDLIKSAILSAPTWIGLDKYSQFRKPSLCGMNPKVSLHKHWRLGILF